MINSALKKIKQQQWYNKNPDIYSADCLLFYMA